MIELLFYHLVSLGISYVIGHAKITYWIRKPLAGPAPWLVELLECVGCTGFWIGVAAQLLHLTPWSAHWVAWGLATAAANLILARFAGLHD